MRKKFVILLGLVLSFLFFSCPSYDPPLEGKDIFIENQTNDYIFVIDSLTGKDNLKLYDTFRVNGKKHIWTNPAYIPKFSNQQVFLSKIEMSSLKEKGVSSIVYYFIRDSNTLRPIHEISKN